MAANTSAIYPLTPNVGHTRLTIPNVARDGSGSGLGKAYVAGANGDIVFRITATESDPASSSTSVAQVVRVFINDTTNSNTTLATVAITGTAGQFSFVAAGSQSLTIGDQITISGTLGGTGTITGYSNPTTYFVIASNGTSTFTLSTTANGSGVVTTAGTPTGLTYTIQPVYRLYVELLMPSTAGTTTAKGGTINYTIPNGLFLPANWVIYCTATLASATTGQVDVEIEGMSY